MSNRHQKKARPIVTLKGKYKFRKKKGKVALNMQSDHKVKQTLKSTLYLQIFRPT